MNATPPTLRKYRNLTSSAQALPWLTPLALGEYREHLRTALHDRAINQVDPFKYNRSGIGDYLHLWSDFLGNLPQSECGAPIRDLLIQEVESKIQLAEAISTGDAAYNKFEAKWKGLPPAEYVALAWDILNHKIPLLPFPVIENDPHEKTRVNGIELQLATLSALAAYNLTHWQVILSDGLAAGMAVNGPRNLVRINSSIETSPLGLRRLLVHEVGGHILRWENSRRQAEPWASVPFGFSVPTEEGFALWLEAEMGVLSATQLHIYAARLIAVSLAQEHGILHVARTLAPFVGDEQAISIAIRVKRGLLDPNREGGQVKDWGYLGGLLKVSEAIGNSPDVADLLAVTKWPLEYIETMKGMRDAGLLQDPHYRPTGDQLGIRS